MSTDTQTVLATAPDDTMEVMGEMVSLPGLSGYLKTIEEQGFVIIPNWISEDRLAKLKDDLARDVFPFRDFLPPDRKTIRAHNLLAKTRGIDDLISDNRLLAIIQGILGEYFQISATTIFDLRKGSVPQPLHQDDSIWPIPRPHPPFVANSMLVVDEFTIEKGATHVVPGSHKWHNVPVRQPPEVEAVQLEMKPGSLMAWDGSMWHGGGANTTDEPRLSINMNFNLAYLRQQENQYVGIPRSELPKMSKRMKRLLGYGWVFGRSGPGMVDMRDPLKMLDLIADGYGKGDNPVPPLKIAK